MRKPIIQSFGSIWVGGTQGTLIGPPALCLWRVIRSRWVTRHEGGVYGPSLCRIYWLLGLFRTGGGAVTSLYWQTTPNRRKSFTLPLLFSLMYVYYINLWYWIVEYLFLKFLMFYLCLLFVYSTNTQIISNWFCQCVMYCPLLSSSHYRTTVYWQCIVVATLVGSMWMLDGAFLLWSLSFWWKLRTTKNVLLQFFLNRLY